MDKACFHPPVFGLELASISNVNFWRASREALLKSSGAESQSPSMKSGWQGFLAAKETLPQ
jgi:hypothetical protein